MYSLREIDECVCVHAVGKEVLEYGIKCNTTDRKHPENTTFSVFTIKAGEV
jgi:hypothetical protein